MKNSGNTWTSAVALMLLGISVASVLTSADDPPSDKTGATDVHGQGHGSVKDVGHSDNKTGTVSHKLDDLLHGHDDGSDDQYHNDNDKSTPGPSTLDKCLQACSKDEDDVSNEHHCTRQCMFNPGGVDDIYQYFKRMAVSSVIKKAARTMKNTARARRLSVESKEFTHVLYPYPYPIEPFHSHPADRSS
ncbi:hypothetical protein PoB_005846500 [Plakobranchus ocellatus]|uniref:Uncharacterized protein n=1 Tax=Plakobranchus ocellatus TaxID=259542 RepID=A0AAV4CGI8_9GAST|nr:hypothetical protein PoB_005846500 [Plakobranchus ocellatus]